jgi:hypothetical protein
MLNALGQLRSLAGRADDARKDFRRAMTLLPSFIEPAINLACLYIEKKASFDREWATRADRLLRDVLAADGGNVRALVLTGTLYMSPVFSRFDDAVKCLTQALPDLAAALRLGALYMEQGRFADAINPLLAAESRDRHSSTAALLLTRSSLMLPTNDLRRCGLLERAERWMTELSTHEGRRGREATALLGKVKDALAACGTPASHFGALVV